MDKNLIDQKDELAEAQELIVQQQHQIASLQRQLEESNFAEELRNAYVLATTTRTVAAPSTHQRLLEVIVRTAAQVIAAQAGSLFLIDPVAQDLVFEVAIGGKAAEVSKLRVPLGHGIAGLVALSGQPMSITNAENSPLQASDVANAVGYTPHSILCVPLYYHDHIIGVLELLDKQGTPSFTDEDIRLLGIFAYQAGIAIEQSRTYQHLMSLFTGVVQSLDHETEGSKQRFLQRAYKFVDRLESEDAGFQFALKLATLMQEVAWAGEREQELGLGILQQFVQYLRSQPHITYTPSMRGL
jgi:transcriptional regulator with GAF, ATPase, and Fis domain